MHKGTVVVVVVVDVVEVVVGNMRRITTAIIVSASLVTVAASDTEASVIFAMIEGISGAGAYTMDTASETPKRRRVLRRCTSSNPWSVVLARRALKAR